LPRQVQAVLFLLQEEEDQHGQRPKAYQSMGAHEWVRIQSRLLFAIGEQDCDVPTHRALGQPCLRLSLPIARRPGACLRERSRERRAHDHDLATVPFADPSGHHRHTHRFTSTRPEYLHKIWLGHPRQRRTQLLPAPSVWHHVINNAQPAIAFPPGRDRKPRSRAARHKHVAQDQLSCNTCVWVPLTGSKARMSASINAMLLAHTTASVSQTCGWRYHCGARGQVRSHKTERPCTKRWPMMRGSWVVE
jgi:hypothetical protein